MRPMDVFLRELKLTGWALSIIPGGSLSCFACLNHKVICIGQEIPVDHQGIVGLHEVGHIHTAEYFPNPQQDPIERYACELAAWDWAERKIPIGFESEFLLIKEFALSSYLPLLESLVQSPIFEDTIASIRPRNE